MFRLIAIEVLNPQSIEMVESPRYKSVHKILSFDAEAVQNHKASKFYYFHKGYSCENGQTTVHQPAETLDDCFFTNSGVRISVSSIVGENGMGKSSLLELFFRLINNVAFALKGGIDKGVSYNLLFVPDVYGRGYFEDSDGSFFSISQINNVLECVYQSQPENNWTYDWNSKQLAHSNYDKPELIRCLSRLFYTVVVNYASYAYNTIDYMREWDWQESDTDRRCEEERCWLSALFHKNDSYQTPIVLNPFRESGNVNYNNERNLTQERLFRLVLNEKSPLKKVLRKKDAKAILFDLNEEYLPRGRRRNHYDSDRVLWVMGHLRLVESGKTFSGSKLTNIAQCVLTAWSRCLGFGLYGKDHSDFWRNCNKERLCALNYLIYKTLKIVDIYPSYADQKYFLQTRNKNNRDRNAAIRSAVEKIYKDQSHITLKLRRCLAYLLFEPYTSITIQNEDGTSYGGISHISDLTQKMTCSIRNVNLYLHQAQEKYGKIPLYKYAKEKPIAWDRDLLMPASFLHTDLLLESEDGEAVTFNSLSSGEKQIIHAVSAMLYQIGNIDSAWENRARMAHYKSVCLVFDEIELYFHPKYQTMLVAFLIESLQNLQLRNVKDIQIILATHSPFILSDIPSSNVLMLRDGLTMVADDFEISNTFCANVFNLLHSHFFMERYVGDFAMSKLRELKGRIIAYREEPTVEEKNAILKMIAMYGDDFLRFKLKRALDI